ncbi:hypothetical protein CIB84_015230 [Bambusicola thoracicus]|uniref:Fringe-like glycosyltransferase domain-containing protein n=1 Tax=Bambusicola thoracicus TaxID=9083 RepID=A0A2P4SAB3_BAMTH|nr:hypothetical protein CIB84_015230 [Bambusicola thoracicus]
MSSSCLGLRRACFLLSVTAAAVLLLLLPRGQPPAAPRRRPPPAGPSRPSPKREARPAGSDVPGERGGGSGAAGGGRDVAGSPWPARRVRLGPPGGSARESLELKDIFIAVKTTRKYHKTRLELLFQTWISRARGQVRDHMINTNCSAVHTRQALCCKMSVEYDKFLESGQKWFCHVDDDNYVNPRTLLRLLSAFSPSQDVYVGRPSLDHPIEAADHVQSDGSVSNFTVRLRIILSLLNFLNHESS